jgi:hypothetical protein
LGVLGDLEERVDCVTTDAVSFGVYAKSVGSLDDLVAESLTV